MECIVIGEQVYKAQHENLRHIKRALIEWKRLTNNTARTNCDNYIRSYRKELEIPQEATIEEEASCIHKKYGAKPYKNQDFIIRLERASHYEREVLPDFMCWLRGKGIEVWVEVNVFMIDEEKHYG